MKLLLLLILLSSSGFGATNELSSSNVPAMAELVIRARARPAETLTYLWYDVEVLRVLTNHSGVNISNRLHAASTRPLPEGELLLYLERFEKQTPGVPKGNWRVIGKAMAKKDDNR
jgi:hypothetical protein